MSNSSAILSLPLIQPAQAQKHVTHNEALRVLDLLVQLVVQTANSTTPPANPVEGERHIVAAGAAGDWAGQDQAIAVFENGAWQFFTPLEGWRADVSSADEQTRFDGSQWQKVEAPLDNLDHLGVNSAADATNRLSVSADATLLTHDGTSHRLKVNKASTADTASLLFQSNWSGRAEMGLAGDDSFQIKTSLDGAVWQSSVEVSGSGDVGIGTSPTAKLDVNGLMKLQPVLTASLPTASSAGSGAIAFVSDAAGGAQLAYCDGTSWLRVADGSLL